MRSVARAALVLSTLATLGAADARAQASLSLGFSAGPLFSGVSFGIGGPAYDVGSVFVGTSFGTLHPSYGSYYGIYSDAGYYDSYGAYNGYGS